MNEWRIVFVTAEGFPRVQHVPCEQLAKWYDNRCMWCQKEAPTEIVIKMYKVRRAKKALNIQ